MNMKFRKQLNNAFVNGRNEKTQKLYQRRICQLVKFHNRMKPEDMGQHHIDQWLAHLVRPLGYSRSTTNQCKTAIKVFFNHIENPMSAPLVSTRNKHYHTDILNAQQIASLLSETHPFYRDIAQKAYSSLLPVKSVLALFPSRTMRYRFEDTKVVYVSDQTVNKKLKAAARLAGINKPVTLQIIRQSGIIHQLESGLPWREVAAKAGLKKRQMKKYIKLRSNDSQY